MDQLAQRTLHEKTIANRDQICEWFDQQTQKLEYPIYSSYDIRDSGYKVTNVDANIYPAGFNNICPTDKETSVVLFDRYLKSHYSQATQKILLVTEEHTSNAYYWDNVTAIKTLLEGSGREVQVALPSPLPEPLNLTSASGKPVTVYSASQDSSLFKTFKPDLIISNNDFTNPYTDWAETLAWPLNPPRELGWYQRKKSTYFKHYNQLVAEFAQVAQIDPFYLNVETEYFPHFEIASEDSRKELAHKVDLFIAKLKLDYDRRGIKQEPFVFVKNNSGTYGLAVIRVSSGAEVLEWSYKSRKKMKAAKGGRDVEEVIIQEGVPSIVKSDGASAEPVIYMIGCELAGGFLRTHQEKSDTDSLNSPGAVYKRLCVSDLEVNAVGCPDENVYGWTAKLGMLAIGREAAEMKVQFKNYVKAACSDQPNLRPS